MSSFSTKQQPRAASEAAGILLGLIGVTIFGGTLPATRIAVEAFDPAFITAGRAAVAGLLAALVLVLQRRRPPPFRYWRTLASSGLLLIVGFPLLSSMALETAEASHGGVVLAVLPLLTAVAATFIGGERPSPPFWIWAFAGSALVAAFVITRSSGGWTFADVLFFGAAMSAALGYALNGGMLRLMPGWEVICWQLALALPLTLTATIWVWPSVDATSIPARSLLAFGYISLFSMFVGFFAWNAGLALGGIAKIGQLQLFQVFVTLAISALLLGEKLDAQILFFAVAVAFCVAMGRRAAVHIKR